MITSLIYEFFTSVISHIYIFYYFYFNFIVVWKQSLHDSYSLKFAEVCFIAWNAANFYKCSMCAWEKHIYCNC